jgi:ankyrin repeat protein
VDGNTALRYAAEQGQFDVVGFLLEMGAEANRPNSYGYSPRYWAVENNRYEIVRLMQAYSDIADGIPPREFA